jgi:ABC-type antimicrobial peptide transport system permease subunit
VILYILLALAIIIAVLGIVNTLALSILERTRELSLLRSVGMYRSQVAQMVTVESVVISLFGALLGLALGCALGAAVVGALKDQGIPVLSFPWVTILGLPGAGRDPRADRRHHPGAAGVADRRPAGDLIRVTRCSRLVRRPS